MGKEMVSSAQGAIMQQRNSVANLVQAIRDEGIGIPSDSFTVNHYFAPMQYAREMVIPAGVVVVGKIHRHAHVSVLSAGACTVFTAGEGIAELTAPCTFVSPEGAQRVIVAHTDVVWTTVHVTNKTDLAEIEREVIMED